MLNNKYYIVRNGDFATCANSKILYSLVAITLATDDYFTNNSTSCFSIMIGSTLVWTFIEFLLYVTNTRIIKPMYLTFSNFKIEIPKYIALFLQGFQEGGLITTIGLYFGDRLYNNEHSFYYILLFHMFILFSVINIITKNNYQKSSKRQINTISSISLMSLVTIYNTFILYLNPVDFYRQVRMLLVMIYFCSFWTFVAWYKGFRNVEIKLLNEPTNKEITYLDTFLILGYDIIFEIGIAYLTFYNLFITI